MHAQCHSQRSCTWKDVSCHWHVSLVACRYTVTQDPRQLLVNIAQDTACGIQYVSDSEFLEEPVGRHDRIQLCKKANKIKTKSLDLKLENRKNTYAEVRRGPGRVFVV